MKLEKLREARIPGLGYGDPVPDELAPEEGTDIDQDLLIYNNIRPVINRFARKQTPPKTMREQDIMGANLMLLEKDLVKAVKRILSKLDQA